MKTPKQKYLHPNCDGGCYYHCTLGDQQKPICVTKFNLDRITKVIEFYHARGTNKESVNNVYRKIIIL